MIYKDQLEAVYRLIEKPENWTKEYFARNALPAELQAIRERDAAFRFVDPMAPRLNHVAHDRRTLLSLLDAQSDEVRLLKELLGMLYDKWENGDPCYQNGDIDCDSLGNAFKLSDEEEKSILDAIGSQP